MKKQLFFLICCIMLKATNSLGQCKFVSPTVELNFITSTVTGYCDINFNVSFDIEQNNGSKFTFIHLWQTGDYQAWRSNPSYNAYSTTQNTQPEFNNPGGDALNILQNAVATIIINNENDPATFETVYGPDPDAPVKSPVTNPGITVVSQQINATTKRYLLSNVIVRIPTPPGPNGCNSPISFTGDAWSSQSNGTNPGIHCKMLGEDFTFTINDITASGIKNCTLPLKYSINLSTSQTTPFDVYYDVYVDNGDNVFNSATDYLVVDDKGPYSISSIQSYSGSNLPYDDPNSPYAGIAYKSNALWYVITAPAVFSNRILYAADNSCATLPVILSNFTASRNGSVVSLNWTTATEINALGFAIEKKMGDNWQQIGFIPSAAAGGNSDLPLHYQFKDNNSSKGITHYRLKLQDLDQQSKYSEVRAVKGENQAAKLIVYPNPSADGRINIVFDNNAASRNITVVDMAGRVVKEIKATTNNTISISGLSAGVYHLKVTTPKTGEQLIEKFIVGKQ